MNDSSPRVESTMNEQPVRSKRSRRLRSALILIVGFGSLSLLIAAGFSVLTSTAGGESLDTIDLPIVIKAKNPGEVVESTFPIANRGTKPIAFELRPSCGCTEVRPMSGTLEPGSTLDVHFGVKLNVEGEEKNVTIAILEGKERKQTSTIQIHAQLPESHKVAPDRIDFGMIGKGKAKTVAFHVEHLGHQAEGTVDRIVAVNCNRTVAVERDAQTEGFIARIEPDDREGMIQGEIQLLVDGTKELKVPIRGEITEPIVAAPRIIELSAGTPVRVILRRIDRRILGEPTLIDAPSGVTVTMLKSNGGSTRLAEIGLDDPTRFHEKEGSRRVRIGWDFSGDRCEVECLIKFESRAKVVVLDHTPVDTTWIVDPQSQSGSDNSQSTVGFPGGKSGIDHLHTSHNFL
jgi:hypothetical protein